MSESDDTKRLLDRLGEQINELQMDSIQRLSELTRHGYGFINIVVRKDGQEHVFEGDWSADMLNRRGPANSGIPVLRMKDGLG